MYKINPNFLPWRRALNKQTVWRHILPAVLLLPALLFSACGSSPEGTEFPKPDEVKVTILPYISYAPFFIAQEEGYFTEQGLNVEFVEFDRTAEIIPALANGKLDVAAGLATIGTFNVIAQDGRIRYVADKGNEAPEGCIYTTLMARNELLDSGELAAPADLRGKRIALSGGSSAEYYLDVILKRAGLSTDDVEIVEAPLPARLEGMINDQLDLAAVSEPWATRIEQAGAGQPWMPMQQVLPNFQLSFLLYGPSFLDDSPELGTRFMAAWMKAVQQYKEGKTARNLEIVSEYTGLDMELLRDSCWQSFSADGGINLQSLLDFQDWADSKGLLIRKLSTEEFWEPGFIQDAMRVLDTNE
jgi:NitT/TauT family transport system substrate-binding protein